MKKLCLCLDGYLPSKKYVDDYAKCDVKGSSTKKIMTIYFNCFHEKNSTTSIVLSLKKYGGKITK